MWVGMCVCIIACKAIVIVSAGLGLTLRVRKKNEAIHHHNIQTCMVAIERFETKTGRRPRRVAW